MKNAKKDCFAYATLKETCNALTSTDCTDCHFYKPAEQYNEEQKIRNRKQPLSYLKVKP